MIIVQPMSAAADVNFVASNKEVSGLRHNPSQLEVGANISGIDGCARSISWETGRSSRIPVADPERLLAGRTVRNKIPSHVAARISRCTGSRCHIRGTSGSLSRIPLADPRQLSSERRVDTGIPCYPAINSWFFSIDARENFLRNPLLAIRDPNADMVSTHMESLFRKAFEIFDFIQTDSAANRHIGSASVLQPGMTANDIARAYGLNDNVQAKAAAKMLLQIVDSLKRNCSIEKIFHQINNKIFDQLCDEIWRNPHDGRLRWLKDDAEVKSAFALLAYCRCLKRVQEGESYAALQTELSNVTKHMQEGASRLHLDIASICIEFSQRHPDMALERVFQHFGISDDENLIRETVDFRLAREQMSKSGIAVS